MEDFYDIKTTRIEGQTVSLFGVFDGTAPVLQSNTNIVFLK
jgi:hypothetical protein